MAKTIQTAIEAGSRMAPAKFYIKITPDGPYLLYGNPPMDQEIIVLNDEGSSWTYRKGNHFSTTEEPTALCRCGASKNKPYCDGSHHHTDWDPKETASHKPLLEDAEEYIGPLWYLLIRRNIALSLVFAMPTVEFGIWYKRPNPKKNVT